MSLTQIREAIEDLSPDERWKLSDWLIETNRPADDDPVMLESLAIAQRHSVELESGKVKEIREEEFWAGVNAGREDEPEDDESLKLAHRRVAELADGTKQLLSENQVWQEINALKAGL